MAESPAWHLAIFVSCLFLSWLLAHLYRLAAGRLGVLDQPNARSAHSAATPTGGGLCFAAVILLGLWALAPAGDASLAAIAPLLLLTAMGFADDCRPLPWPVRLAAQTLAAGWLLVAIGMPYVPWLAFLPEAALLALWLAALVWLLNLYNFMDGIDGIAAAEAAFVAGAGLLLAWLAGTEASPLLLLALGAALGFLIINWPPARLFMGDAGSGFLGLLFCFCIAADLPPGLPVWLILLGWFLTDASLTLALRLLRRETIFEAHSVHAYQHLNRRLGTPRTLALLLAIKGLWLLPLAGLAALQPAYAWILVALAFAPLLAFQALAGAGQARPQWRRMRSD